MAVFSITGDDTITINGRGLNDFAVADTVNITYDEDRLNMKTGKNLNSIITENTPGRNAMCEVRLLRNSGDDQFLQNYLNQQEQDIAASLLLNGTAVKRTGDGQGNTINEVMNMQGGIIRRNPGTKGNADGDIEQGVVIYMMKFAYVTRSHQ